MTEQPEFPVEQPVISPAVTQHRIIANLDELDRGAKREPFTFVVSGRPITLADPGDLDWKVLDNLENEREYLTVAMTPEDYAFFIEQELPIWKMERLGRLYQEHYGAGEPGKAD